MARHAVCGPVLPADVGGVSGATTIPAFLLQIGLGGKGRLHTSLEPQTQATKSLGSGSNESVSESQHTDSSLLSAAGV